MANQNNEDGTVGVGVAILDNGNKVACVFRKDGGIETVIRLAYDRKGVDLVIAALERCKLHFPEETNTNDASNLPPMSNKVEGGGHFGLG